MKLARHSSNGDTFSRRKSLYYHLSFILFLVRLLSLAYPDARLVRDLVEEVVSPTDTFGKPMGDKFIIVRFFCFLQKRMGERVLGRDPPV